MSLLALEQLQVAYGGIRAVKCIDVVIGEGELVCLIGANGAGKTTTLKAICRLLQSGSRTISYAGNDINDIDCMRFVGLGIAVKDAYPEVLPHADYVTMTPGGYGAVREICYLFKAIHQDQPS